MARVQLDRHVSHARSIFHDGRQRPAVGGHPTPALTFPHAPMGTLAVLATELSDRSDDDLRRLLLLRPDAMNPPVPDFAALAARLSMRTSIELALDQLNAKQLQTLAALLAGTDSPDHAPYLPALHELALVTQTSPEHKQVKYDAGSLRRLPLAAVAPALDGSFTADVPLLPLPTVAEPVTVRVRMRDNASAAAIDTLLRGMAALLDSVPTAGIESLRGGTVGVRALRMLAKSARIDEAQLCFYLELAAMAGLITLDDAAWQWRAVAAEWNTLDRPGQWVVLVQAWLSSGRPPGGRPLAPTTPHRHAETWRRHVVLALSQLSGPPTTAPSIKAPAPKTPAGTVPTVTAPTAASLLAFMTWQHPRQSAHMALQLQGILAELELLGITGAGALSAPGSAVAAADWDGASARVSMLLPAPIEHFLIQGDLTAVAPGFLAPAVAAQLKLMAVAEGDGTAGIYRFSQGSLEDAIRSGMNTDAILNFLQRHCSTAVPQSLGYLIGAAARTVSATTSSAATSSAPTRSAAPLNPSDRSDTLVPAGIGTTPTVVAQSAQRQPAKTTQPTAAVVRAEVEAQIMQLRSQPVWANAGGVESGPALIMEQLRQAVVLGGRILLQAVDGTGTVERVLLEPVSLEAGMLRARLPGSGRERRFNIHRIVAAEAALDKQEEDHG